MFVGFVQETQHHRDRADRSGKMLLQAQEACGVHRMLQDRYTTAVQETQHHRDRL